MTEKNTPEVILPPFRGDKLLSPAGVPKLLSTGSATGNPRNKCALQPGHSLMDWIRLGNSGVDLSGTCGRIVPVSKEELARHNKRDDAWMAIRGKVYNVTRYMDFHPGGVDELMRGVGRDATKLFDEVHAWVNYQQLLNKCLIGPLKIIVKPDAEIFKSIKTETNKVTIPNANIANIEIIPRIDWIQKQSDITFYIYTRQFCNPGLVLKYINEKEFRLLVQIEHTKHCIELQLQSEVRWPPKACKLSSETGKIEICFEKVQEMKLWNSYGAHTLIKVLPTDDAEEYNVFKFEIKTNTDFNHDSFEMILRGSQDDTLFLLPLGYHVNISTDINGEPVERSYTPIPQNFLSKTLNTNKSSLNEMNLNFLIKNYKANGLLSEHMQQLNVGSHLLLSVPRGNFKLQHLLRHKRFTFLAAGSGLTPFLSIIQHLLKRFENKIEYLRLIYFNKTEADIWCRNALTDLQVQDERFHLTNILSQADEKWQGPHGRISKDLFTTILDRNSAEYSTYLAICGPNPYNQLAEDILKELQFDKENLHIFRG
ncbi:cytochrome b5 reductase 4-like isoform X1 [Teleopsis dalmanni]|uniref:cytochrome b5 reductase 4-like isoform X1 n=2 Tax=Teleopsis dalmanni TaxID=139649 RepID=UPI000D32C3FD|nr:cytochrome b5 reductase 4-like isoform X1 [Teleopsis dalmanni]XP_037954497.1 cytochrome b5 reductase 4-like isoform X1 [Teleopsis dalmanni]